HLTRSLSTSSLYTHPSPTPIHTLSLHDALPISPAGENFQHAADTNNQIIGYSYDAAGNLLNDGVNAFNYVYGAENRIITAGSVRDRKSTRLNSSHVAISYAVFCLKKKNTRRIRV